MQPSSHQAALLLSGLQQGSTGGCALLLWSQQHPPALPQSQQVFLQAHMACQAGISSA